MRNCRLHGKSSAAYENCSAALLQVHADRLLALQQQVELAPHLGGEDAEAALHALQRPTAAAAAPALQSTQEAAVSSNSLGASEEGTAAAVAKVGCPLI